MRATAALLALSVCGCDKAPSPAEQRLSRQADTTLVNPPGRYQMVAQGTGVYVLDTRYGQVRWCQSFAEQFDSTGKKYVPMQVGCTKPDTFGQ